MKPVIITSVGLSTLFVAYFLNGQQSFLPSTSQSKCPLLKDVQYVKKQITNPW